MIFFDSLIVEHESSYQLKNSDIQSMTTDINKYFDSVTNDKNALIAEEVIEATADAVAAAATIAAACGSWIPFVNFGLAAASVAATAVALGLEIASENLQGTIVEEISNADSKIITSQSFNNIQTYSKAVTANSLFYPRLQLGATIKQMRALFIGVIIVIKKSNKGKVTSQDIKQVFTDYYNATQADSSLVEEYIQLMKDLDESKDIEKTKEDIKAFFGKLPDVLTKGYAMIMVAFSLSVAINKGKIAYQAYKAAKDIVPPDINMEDLNSEGEIAGEGEAVGEAEIIGTAEIAVRAMGVLAGIASVVFSVLEIVKAVDTDQKLTKAISDAKTGITNYYTQLVTQSV